VYRREIRSKLAAVLCSLWRSLYSSIVVSFIQCEHNFSISAMLWGWCCIQRVNSSYTTCTRTICVPIPLILLGGNYCQHGEHCAMNTAALRLCVQGLAMIETERVNQVVLLLKSPAFDIPQYTYRPVFSPNLYTVQLCVEFCRHSEYQY
jgi:hypothetical protein